jgi:hypothetical protein
MEWKQERAAKLNKTAKYAMWNKTKTIRPKNIKRKKSKGTFFRKRMNNNNNISQQQ